MTDTPPARKGNGRIRIRIGLGVTILGFLVYLLGAEPGLFRLDRSPVVGFVQIATFLVGLGIICLGGYICLASLWNGSPKSIASDIGLRLVSTGYVISVACGMADVFGFGSNSYPKIPIFGIFQQIGFMAGEVVIGIGLLLLIPYKKPKPNVGDLPP
jgi:hypothetical protein